jgi:hypothetical protein
MLWTWTWMGFIGYLCFTVIYLVLQQQNVVTIIYSIHTYYQNTNSNYIDFTVHPYMLQPPKRDHKADFPQQVVSQVITLHVNNILKPITK